MTQNNNQIELYSCLSACPLSPEAITQCDKLPQHDHVTVSNPTLSSIARSVKQGFVKGLLNFRCPSCD